MRDYSSSPNGTQGALLSYNYYNRNKMLPIMLFSAKNLVLFPKITNFAEF